MVPDTDERVKIKYEEYVRLHRIVTGLNSRTVWEGLVAGRTAAEIAEGLPDEFHLWVRDITAELTATVEARTGAIETAYQGIVATLGPAWTRKDFALVASRHPERGALFKRLDGRDYRPYLWQQARPEADRTPGGRAYDEDA